MFLNPYFYQKIVRPKFAIEKYIKKIVAAEFDFGEAKVLDFGCGTGSNAFLFKPENYLGAEVDKDRIAFAEKMLPQYKFAAIESGAMPVADNSFDFIVIFATIHHIPDDIFQGYIKEFSRVLKSGGQIVMIEPVISEKNKIGNWFMKIFDNGKFIREEKKYLDFFAKDFSVTVHKRFSKFFFYNELFFSAKKKI